MSGLVIADQLTHARNLGGGIFILKTMLGAHHISYSNQNLKFFFKMNPKMNLCEIALDWRDLYEMTFYKMSYKKMQARKVEEFDMLYAEDLRRIFEETTGLRTNLR